MSLPSGRPRGLTDTDVHSLRSITGTCSHTSFLTSTQLTCRRLASQDNFLKMSRKCSLANSLCEYSFYEHSKYKTNRVDIFSFRKA